jgi:phospholipid/cholesterol/gamma-HCH transport system permease protein
MLKLFQSAMHGLGAPVVVVAREARALTATGWHTLRVLVSGGVPWRATLNQAYEIGNCSVLFITVTLGFLGLISFFQTATQIQQILPDFRMLGAAFLTMMVREFGPTITGLMMATRVGSGIAAELGSMKVTEQIDAIRMCNADPVRELVLPRTLACAFMLPLLSVYAVCVAVFAGMLCADVAFGVNYRTFLSLRLVGYSDVLVGLVKAFAYGIVIPVIAGHAGLRATGGSAGVGWATTQAVVATSFAVIVIDLILSAAGYLLFP